MGAWTDERAWGECLTCSWHYERGYDAAMQRMPLQFYGINHYKDELALRAATYLPLTDHVGHWLHEPWRECGDRGAEPGMGCGWMNGSWFYTWQYHEIRTCLYIFGNLRIIWAQVEPDRKTTTLSSSCRPFKYNFSSWPFHARVLVRASKPSKTVHRFEWRCHHPRWLEEPRQRRPTLAPETTPM